MRTNEIHCFNGEGRKGDEGMKGKKIGKKGG
jgi:hypothetical protein